MVRAAGSARQTIGEGLRLRLAVLRARPPRGTRTLIWHPEPRGTGSVRRGNRILSGLWHFAGQLVEAPGADPWAIDAPSVPFAMQLHGQGWLDDVMAAGGRTARQAAQGWVLDWARRFGGGTGPGWDAALTGRRLLRQIGHAPDLLEGMRPEERDAFLNILYVQAVYLRRHWQEAAPGLPRMEALTGLLHGGLALDGLEALAGDATQALCRAVAEDVGEDGGIASRNPEALLEVAMLLGWCIDALARLSAVPGALSAAQARIVPTLRALRHADGGLARFHGGGRGRSGRLDRVLAASGAASPGDGLAMGFAAIAHGRTTLVVDAAAPPTGRPSGSAHASSLAFELTSGPCPVVVNCGPGGGFGAQWHRAGRATASHSTVEIEGWSSARVGPTIAHGPSRIAPLVQGPGQVRCERSAAQGASTLTLSHDGYAPSHGLTHLRRLMLSTDGRILRGEDSLRAVTGADRQRFEDVQARLGLRGVPFHCRFHLHPDTLAEADMGGRAVSLTLASGEVWVFRPGREIALSLEASVHLEPGRLKPRAAQQVVLSDRVVTYAATIDWTLRRAQEAAEGSATSAGRA